MNKLREKILISGTIPIMSEEGLEELTKYCINFYSNPTNSKLDPSRNLRLPNSQKADNGTITSDEILKTRCNILFYLLKDLKNQFEISEEKALSNMIKVFHSTVITTEDMKEALNFPASEIENLVMSGNTEKLPHVIKCLYNKFTNLKNEREAKSASVPYDTRAHKSTMDHDYRIYINTPMGINKYKFLELYTKKCIERHIPFDMKGDRGSEGDRQDKTVLYAHEENLDDVLEILEEIENEIPEVISTFGSPVSSGYNYSYYSLCSCGSRGNTYNDWFNAISAKAFLCVSGKLMMNDEDFFNSLTQKEKNVVMSLSNEKNFKDELCGVNGERLKANASFTSLEEQQITSNLLKKFLPMLDEEDIKNMSNIYGKCIGLFCSYNNFGVAKHGDFPICFKERFYTYNSQTTNEAQTKESDNKHKILYETEDIFFKLFKELKENNYDEESIEEFIENISSISKAFEVCSSLEKDFKKSDRYIKIKEVISILSSHKKFVPDKNVGNGINEVNKKRHYRNIKEKLIATINILTTKSLKRHA